MAILEKEVWVNASGRNAKYYKNKGYKIPKSYDKKGRDVITRDTKILVKVDDLSKGSNIKLTKICDECGLQSKKQPYILILKCRNKTDGKDRCATCGKKYSTKKRKIQVPYQRSLEYFSQNKNKILLEEFSSKNKKSPCLVYYGETTDYIWRCSVCNEEYIASPNRRTNSKSGCPYCSKRKIAKSNSLWSTHPQIASLLFDSNKGYQISHGMQHKELFKCEVCDKVVESSVLNVVYRGLFCPYCSDKISYPEKFMANLLYQLNVKFNKETTFQWSDKKRFDFYLPDHNCIIETHGEQHYNGSFQNVGGRNKEEEQINDEFKKSLARKNGIDKYITIDCRKSNLDYIQKSVLNSEIAVLFELTSIDWIQCHEVACKSIIKDICYYWTDTNNDTLKTCLHFDITLISLKKYLQKGEILGIINSSKTLSRPKKDKSVYQLTLDNKIIKEWNNLNQIATNLNLRRETIKRCCQRYLKTSFGYKWMYKEDYEKYITEQNKELVTT